MMMVLQIRLASLRRHLVPALLLVSLQVANVAGLAFLFMWLGGHG